jgi:predicted nucleic acid-binding protein
MTPAFWDTSALVPLCVQQQPSAAVRQMLQRYQIAVWWATPVEMRSAFERLLRMGQLTGAEYAAAGVRLDKLRRSWRELQASEPLRAQAETFLTRYPLKSADALQLAAAWIWCTGKTQTCTFISADAQLLEAAHHAGFQIVAL